MIHALLLSLGCCTPCLACFAALPPVWGTSTQVSALTIPVACYSPFDICVCLYHSYTQHACHLFILTRLRPQPFVIDSYVVEVQDGSSGSNITDLVSFYTLPSSVLGHVEHKELRAAYMFYTGNRATGQHSTATERLQGFCVFQV